MTDRDALIAEAENLANELHEFMMSDAPDVGSIHCTAPATIRALISLAEGNRSNSREILDRIGERIADEVEKAAAGRQTNCEQAAIDVLSLASPSTDLSLRNPSGETIRSTMGGATGGHDDDRTVAGSHGPLPLASQESGG